MYAGCSTCLLFKNVFLSKLSFSRPLSYVQNEKRSTKLSLTWIEIELKEGFLAIDIRFSSSSLEQNPKLSPNFKI